MEMLFDPEMLKGAKLFDMKFLNWSRKARIIIIIIFALL